MKHTNDAQSLKKILDEIIAKPYKFFHYGIKSKKYANLKMKILKLAGKVFGLDGPQQIKLKKIGTIHIPFFSYGNITSTNMWDLEDMILFSYYLKKSNFYDAAYDLGANIGFHSIIFSKLGYKKVTCFEPEIDHLEQIKKNKDVIFDVDNKTLSTIKAIQVLGKSIFNEAVVKQKDALVFLASSLYFLE